MILKYKTREELENALYEAAIQKSSIYKNMNFLNEVFGNNKTLKKDIQQMIVKKQSPNKIYKFMLECGCASKYNNLAEFMDFPNEEEILFDLDEDHDWGGYYEDNDLDDYDDDFRDYDDDDDDDEYDNDDNVINDYFLNRDEEDDMDDFPNEWIAEKEGKKMTFKLPLNEGEFDMNKFKNEVLRLEKEGYKVRAIEKKKLNEDVEKNFKINRISIIKKLLSGTQMYYNNLLQNSIKSYSGSEHEKMLQFSVVVSNEDLEDLNINSKDQLYDYMLNLLRKNEEICENENNINITHYNVTVSSHDLLNDYSVLIYIHYNMNNN